MPKKYQVILKPWDKKVEVSVGENILKLLTAQGLYIDSVCGGIGKCGKCKVQVMGKYKTKKTELISKKEIEEGYCLACQTQIKGDVEIFVPPSSRLGEPQILTKSEIIKIEKVAPLINKYRLKLPRPTLTDNISDLERLQRVLKYQNVDIDL
ncbi:MAG: 2Fe-2S iron-sulfur cluster-binding protein, partial [Candidatus Thermoplasmatota archaeon]